MGIDSPQTVNSQSDQPFTVASSPVTIVSSQSDQVVNAAVPLINISSGTSAVPTTIEHVISSDRSHRSDSSEEIRLLEAREEAARIRLELLEARARRSNRASRASGSGRESMRGSSISSMGTGREEPLPAIDLPIYDLPIPPRHDARPQPNFVGNVRADRLPDRRHESAALPPTSRMVDHPRLNDPADQQRQRDDRDEEIKALREKVARLEGSRDEGKGVAAWLFKGGG